VSHRAHDYAHLVRRWRAVARQAGVRLTPFAHAEQFDVFFLQTPALAATGGLYISAGIHGDEAGATEGLIAWAEKNARRLATLPLLIFPCLNPWGLTQNLRTNEAGLDLNRTFAHDDAPVTRMLRTLLRPHRFTLALTLHEDYDAQGVYLYEVRGARPFWGEQVLAKVARHLPLDPRRKIDISTATGGIIRRRFDERRATQIGGFPEAVYLQQHHAERSITFETPSEFALERRVAAQAAAIEACVRLAA
jgi:murein peptide amidase A